MSAGPWAHTLAACDVADALAVALRVQADAVAATASGDSLGLRSLASALAQATGYLRQVATVQPRPEGDS